MNREIKFRGLRTNGNGWAHGMLLSHDSIGKVGHSLNTYTYTEVNPETVCQFTGLHDKNRKEIYEGDIVSIDFGIDDPDISQVKFTDGGFVVEADFGDYDMTTIGWAINMADGVEVIGNIHENPELMEGGTHDRP